MSTHEYDTIVQHIAKKYHISLSKKWAPSIHIISSSENSQKLKKLECFLNQVFSSKFASTSTHIIRLWCNF